MDQVEVMQECDACEKLLCKLLDVGTWERHEAVRFEEIEYALPVEVCNNADMIPEVEAVAKVNAAVDVVLVIRSQCRQYSQLDSTGISVFWHGSNDFDGAVGALSLVVRLDDLAECALAEQFGDLI